ncbi:MAG TPA: hypothetical protein DCY20_00300 [Firmicutes bacterium]|nr:hypothetical protein [Bacillota bacterium]
MLKKQLLLERLERIGQSLSQRKTALALLSLGSVGLETNRLDEYSDLDFFVLCENGAQEQFLTDVSWLSDVHPIAFIHRNTKDGYKVLYEDGVFCEFAIFDIGVLDDIAFSKGRLIWKREGFDEGLCIPKQVPPLKTVDIQFCVDEALTNLYVGLCRYHRGEKLSAHEFIVIFARDHVLNLITMLETPEDVVRDEFTILRRFEFRYPKYVSLLSEIVVDYDDIPKAAAVILAFLDEHFKVNAKMKETILKMCH